MLHAINTAACIFGASLCLGELFAKGRPDLPLPIKWAFVLASIIFLAAAVLNIIQ